MLATGVLVAGTAYADESKKKEGCEKRGESRFQKADKNSDGFLTADEVGEKRWAHIKVADANADGKVSLAEMKKAKADGKLGHGKHKHKGKGHKKKDKPAAA